MRSVTRLGALVAFVSIHLISIAQVPSPRPMVRSPRCAQISKTPDAPTGSDLRAIEVSLYAAIVQLRKGDQGGALVVESRSLPIPPLRVADDRGLMDQLPDELRTPVREGVPQCFDLSADRFPPGTRLVPVTEITQAGSVPADWPSIAARFDGARMWFAFSRALISADRRDAVVFYERPCTARCGEAEWVWFHRDSPTAPWRVIKEVWNWIS